MPKPECYCRKEQGGNSREVDTTQEKQNPVSVPEIHGVPRSCCSDYIISQTSLFVNYNIKHPLIKECFISALRTGQVQSS